MLSADRLTPRKSDSHPETMSLATYLVLVLQSQSIWPGPQGTLRLPDPVTLQSPTLPGLYACRLLGPSGPKRATGRDGGKDAGRMEGRGSR